MYAMVPYVIEEEELIKLKALIPIKFSCVSHLQSKNWNAIIALTE